MSCPASHEQARFGEICSEGKSCRGEHRVEVKDNGSSVNVSEVATQHSHTPCTFLDVIPTVDVTTRITVSKFSHFFTIILGKLPCVQIPLL